MKLTEVKVGLILLCLVTQAVFAQAAETHRFKSVTGTLVTLENGESISLYGLRLDLKKKHEAIGWFKQRISNVPFRVDSSAFEKAGFKKNRYGDRHAMIMLPDGGWLQEELIRNGLALWSGAALYPPSLRSRLLAAEKEAREERRGLWARFRIFKAEKPIEKKFDGQFVLVEGHILDVYRSAKVTYLNFGDDWRRDFTVAVSSRDRKNFAHESWKFRNLVHSWVLVRGILRFYNGPYLEISFPEQLEITRKADG